ncbi:uncharacterized protein LOC128127306 [Lactuca sativa]|uniref:uncharacterized protein LOC128127306 n=1 Tax=Lactuca sativa TaxID=4236 RepID=UPI0022AE96EE|nr:uncharacterized protein LOC128127306 [Lactuca sativa]
MSTSPVKKFRGSMFHKLKPFKGSNSIPFFDIGSSGTQELPTLHAWTKDHPANQVIGNPNVGVQTPSAASVQNECHFSSFISMVKPKSLKAALENVNWITTMQEELAEFDKNEVWTPVPPPLDYPIVDSSMVADFAKLMVNRFQKSMNRELSFFLGLQVKQTNRRICIHQEKYILELIKKYLMDTYASAKQVVRLYVCNKFVCQISSQPKDVSSLGCETNIPIPQSGLQLERKSTSGGCQFLSGRFVSWSYKKKKCIAVSKTEAEYIVVASYTSQVMWMKSQIFDYGYHFQHILIYCDSQSAISISHNPIKHSMTKHIDIHYHFIKDHVLNGNIELIFVPSDDEIVDVFTKELDETKFNGFLNKMGMMRLDPQFFLET